MSVISDDSKIVKNVIHAGKHNVEFCEGSKVTFHFQTQKINDDTVLDDTRKTAKPMELILGKKFKLEVWESILPTMAVGEVAKFIVDKSLVLAYPFIAKTLRDFHKSKDEVKHSCCGMMEQGTGYPDLDALISKPTTLEFTFELLCVEGPTDYAKQSWQLNETEKLDSVPRLREEGNAKFKDGQYTEASRLYGEALGRLEYLMSLEKPGDEEWKELEKQQIPLLLNYAQCRLLEKDYYSVIEHCTTVIDKDPDNVKALFRRGKAHIGAWNPRESRADFDHVLEVDPSLRNAVQKELRVLEEMQRERNVEDRKNLEGKMFSS